MQVKPNKQPVIVSVPICHYEGQCNFFAMVGIAWWELVLCLRSSVHYILDTRHNHCLEHSLDVPFTLL